MIGIPADTPPKKIKRSAPVSKSESGWTTTALRGCWLSTGGEQRTMTFGAPLIGPGDRHAVLEDLPSGKPCRMAAFENGDLNVRCREGETDGLAKIGVGHRAGPTPLIGCTGRRRIELHQARVRLAARSNPLPAAVVATIEQFLELVDPGL